jgi:hypothetical protein
MLAVEHLGAHLVGLGRCVTTEALTSPWVEAWDGFPAVQLPILHQA